MQVVIQYKMVNQTLLVFLFFLIAVRCEKKESLYLQHLQKFVDIQQLSSTCLNQISNSDLGTLLQNLYNIIRAFQNPQCSSYNILDSFSTPYPSPLYQSFFLVLDAGFRIPSGLAAGNFFELGNYDECINIKSNATSESEKIHGKYCLGTIPFSALSQSQNAPLDFSTFLGESKLPLKMRPIHPEPRMLGTDETLMGWHVALCVPHKCTAKELSGILTFTEQFCYSSVDDKKKLDTEAIIGTSILSVFLLIVVVSTLFDVYLFYKERELPHPLLTAFSFLSNGKKLFATSSNPNQLHCLNGIKAVSMMWVILGHMYSSMYFNALTNSGAIQDFMKELPNMFIVSATVSVDSFFVVGGLVMVYTFMKTMEKTQVKNFNIFLFYLHRYLRLTPALAACILLTATLIKYMGDGPLWGNVDDSFCRKYWWSTLLYIQNYVNPTATCLAQSWYLSVDMQLFVLTPMVLIPLIIWPRYTMWCLYALVVAGIIVPFAIAFDLKMNGILGTDRNYMQYYYIQTYARFGTYVIGMILGYYVYKLKKSGKPHEIHWVTLFALWIVILGGLVASLYAPHSLTTDEYDRWAHSLYIGFGRAGWAVCLSGLIYLCIAGYGGPIDTFLSIPIFQFLSKVSYSMYLVHYNLISMWFASKRTAMKFSNIEAMMDFWGIFMLTLALSLILCLVFESPVIIIEKCIFGTGAKKSHPKSKESKLKDVEMSKS